jgi:uncharacterized repeat protein (TIGR01451 family)
MTKGTIMKGLRIALCTLLMCALTGLAQAQDTVGLTMYFPTGDSATSVIKLDKQAPSSVLLNKDFSYNLTVTNISKNTVSNVKVTETLAQGFTFISASPEGTAMDGGKIAWNLGTIPAGGSKAVTVTGKAAQVGSIENCAAVTYDMGACLAINVINPAIKLTKTAPDTAMLCDTIPMTITVANTGVGAARNVVVTDSLPQGLTTLDGKTGVKFTVPVLEQGESKTFNLVTKAAKTGKYTNTAQATADGGMSSEASASTMVQQPVLTITKTGPDKRFEGRPVPYTISVSNTGDAVAKQVTIMDIVPVGSRFLKASDGGTVQGNNVVWNIGDLAPGAKKTVELSLVGTKLGEIVNNASVTANCANSASAKASTQIAGIPAILLELIDEQDPIEVGSNVTYMIRVTNQGSLEGTNIKIDIELEDTMEYVSASGATTATLNGNKISMAPLPRLDPKKQAVWKVVIKSVKSGDVRFGVNLTSDQIDRPVRETESTNFY